jgi:hypothetical protein
LEKCPVNALSPQAPVLWPEKQKNRAQSVDSPAAPNSSRYGRSAVTFSASDVTAPHRREIQYPRL